MTVTHVLICRTVRRCKDIYNHVMAAGPAGGLKMHMMGICLIPFFSHMLLVQLT
jgi:hypothetical protein